MPGPGPSVAVRGRRAGPGRRDPPGDRTPRGAAGEGVAWGPHARAGTSPRGWLSVSTRHWGEGEHAGSGKKLDKARRGENGKLSGQESTATLLLLACARVNASELERRCTIRAHLLVLYELWFSVLMSVRKL